MSISRKCKVEGCELLGYLDSNGIRSRYPNGYCQTHYTRIRRNGTLDRSRRILGARANHPLTNTWHGMMKRCYDERHISYKSYGGRGVKVCDRWRVFDNFAEDLVAPPEGMTLDRIDVSGNYEPNNCRWATNHEQANNRSNSTYLTIDGETKTIEQWSIYSPVYGSTIRRRIARGYSPKDAVFAPQERKRKTAKKAVIRRID